MHKQEAFLCCGIDVSAAQLAVALAGDDGKGLQRSFPNQASGHREIAEIGDRGNRGQEAVKKSPFLTTGRTDTSYLKCFDLPISLASAHFPAPVEGFYAGCTCRARFRPNHLVRL